jgi:hypothetical protein
MQLRNFSLTTEQLPEENSQKQQHHVTKTVFVSAAYRVGEFEWNWNSAAAALKLSSSATIFIESLRICFVVHGTWRNNSVQFSNTAISLSSSDDDNEEATNVVKHRLAVIAPAAGDMGNMHMSIFCNHMPYFLDKQLGENNYEIIIVNQVGAFGTACSSFLTTYLFFNAERL